MNSYGVNSTPPNIVNAKPLQPAAPAPLLVDAREAARLLSISDRTLRDRTKDGTVPAVKLEGRILYSPKALADWVDQQIALRTAVDLEKVSEHGEHRETSERPS